MKNKIIDKIKIYYSCSNNKYYINFEKNDQFFMQIVLDSDKKYEVLKEVFLLAKIDVDEDLTEKKR